ncbi:Zinc finger A20 and AN1 domain-containing stress-associated protein 8 [Capsicum chinense]|nr:Zinc finger A20 and AN1 domain-containing stress-associated protein 8 [Capsicum chinense]
MVMFSFSFCLGTSQEETQMKGCDTRGGMVANVDVSIARQLISRGDGNRVMDYFAWFGCIELWKVDMISNLKRWEVHLGLELKVDSQVIISFYMRYDAVRILGCHRGMHGKYKVMSWFSRASSVTRASPPQYDLRRHTCGVELDLLTVDMESSKETGCRAPEDPVLCIKDCDFFGSAATMNMCSKCQKDMILLKQEHAKLAATSSKDVIRRRSSNDESELALAGAAVASVDFASQISQVKSKKGLKKCKA